MYSYACFRCFVQQYTFLMFFPVLFALTSTCTFANEELVSKLDLNKYSMNEKRYLLYDVNHGEGFNLRRDVYMRMANLVRVLREKGHNFILVLPPWGGLYHWQSRSLGEQTRIPWRLFFDVESLRHYVPVVEFEEYIKERGRAEVDTVYYLQPYAEGWKEWEEKFHFRPCIEQNFYYRSGKVWKGWFFGYEGTFAHLFQCISIQGHASTLIPLILADNNTGMSIMIDRAETILHDTFGDISYWKARRSMRYNKELVRMGDEFRRLELNSTDEQDRTHLASDWRNDVVTPGQATGGPFVCIHWRRNDFAKSHASEVPSIEGTARQIERLVEMLNLNVVFLATDAPESEVNELKEYLAANISLKRFQPSATALETYKDGGVAIIDQWICAHARYFIGSHVSTFSFRIQEDREILGFAHESTFNRLCPDGNLDCEQPSRWTLQQ